MYVKKKIILSLFVLLMLPVAFAGTKCCDEVDGMKFLSITVSYKGAVQPGDEIEVTDGVSPDPDTYDAYALGGTVYHQFTSKPNNDVYFRLVRGGNVISETKIHVSCSRAPIDDDFMTNDAEWDVLQAEFSGDAYTDACAILACGEDLDGDGVGHLCDNCLDYNNPPETVEQCKCDDVNSLTVKYTGTSTATTATVYEGKDSTDPSKIRATVPVVDGIITVSTSDLSNGEFKSETTFLVGTDEGTFHTSCSKPLGPGVIDSDTGLFEIVSADLVNPKDCIIEEGDQPPCLDFGDAPDPSTAPAKYPTLFASNGARHVIVPGVFLGAIIDAEPDGQPSMGATGDDVSNLADEDGVIMPPAIIQNQLTPITVIAGPQGCLLDAWMDYNQDGDWDDAGEQIFTGFPLTPGVPNPLFVTVPLSSSTGLTYARFRCSTAGGLTPYGKAPDGEVEDYAVVIEPAGYFCDDEDYICIEAETQEECATICSDAGALGCFYDTEKCSQTGYGCLCKEDQEPGGANIPEFSATTIILIVAIVGLGIALILKKK